MALTDKSYWTEHWDNYEPKEFGDTSFMKDFQEYMPADGARFLEVGGFPGYWSAHLKRAKRYDVTVLDICSAPNVVRKLEAVNELEPGSINFVEADFLTYKSDRKFDLVMSFGFAEHFDDTREVLERHLDLLDHNGCLLVTMPNFRGLNGFLQWIFDRDSYDRHNIEAMRPQNLNAICRSLGLREYKVRYWGGSGRSDVYLWIDSRKKIPWIISLAVRALSKFIAQTRIENRFFAPHIVIAGYKR